MLISGGESLLIERAVAEALSVAREAAPDLEVTEIEAAQLDRNRLAEISGPSLFATQRAVVISELGGLPAEVVDDLLALITGGLDDLVLIAVHPGGQRGKGILERIRAAGVRVIECPPPKNWELPQFVLHEARRHGGVLAGDAAATLVDAVGHDLRALAGAVAQLVDDAPGREVSRDQVRRYFAGRAEVTSFAVADAALAGQAGTALGQLRWALSTGVVPVLITSALASGLRSLGKLVSAPAGLREAELARAVGVPPWKIKSLRGQARGWDDAGLAQALRIVAAADADIKGAADDAGFALERAVLAVSRARRS